jgi:cysteine desulfurase
VPSPPSPAERTAYLDHAASTPMRPEAVAAVVDVLERVPGNPSGQHRWAREARRRLDDARDLVAELIGARPSEVVFTSGGTEADNLAVVGAVAAGGGLPVCLAGDHHAVLDPVRAAGGRALGHAGPGRRGRATVDLDELAGTLAAQPGVAVVSLAAVNNEVGVVQPVAEAAATVRERSPGTAVHVDAVAAASWLDLAPMVAAADLLTISGHKVGGPKGVGVLVVRDGTALAPLLQGGAQERERRPGTPNLAGAVGLAAALERVVAERAELVGRVAAQRDRLRAGILAAVGDGAVDTLALVEPGAPQVANVVHLSCRGVHREALLLRLDRDGVAASAGSSCASGAVGRSHVVEAMGVPDGLADGSLRLSLGWCTTDDEVDHALATIPAAIVELRGTAPEGPGR